ncbi:MAG: hypothetical protein JSW46_08990 [Gemmatimonadota bacterium]|nr:MAG: hypothetical protein JSW46_08990 [Gemmatimonadota bacterium]
MAESVSGIVSVFILVVGLSYLIQADEWVRWIEETTSNPQRLMTLGLLLLVMGLALVSAHNLWVADWRVVITVFSWGAAVKGALLLLFPQLGRKFHRWSESFLRRYMRVAGGLWAVLGAWLCYEVWFAA